MKKIGLIIIIATTTLFSCKNTSKAMNSDRIEPSGSSKNYTKGGTTAKEVVYDVILSFISKGEGIDHKLKNKVDEIIKTFNEKNNTTLKPEIIGWGREGEVDYNFIAKNLSTSQKSTLAQQIKAAIGSSDMVHVSYNKKSVHKR